MKRLIDSKNQLFSLMIEISDMLDKRGKLMVRLSAAPKTLEQLKKLYAHLPELTAKLFERGEIKRNLEDHAKYWLKREIKYGKFYEFNEGVVFDAASFADASIDVLIEAIDKTLLELER